MLNRPHLTPLLRSALLCIAALLAHATPPLATAAPNLGGGSGKCDPTVQSCAPGTGGGIDLGGGGGGGGSGGGTCTPTPGGSPCGGAGPATQGNSSSTHQGAGNPIHLINGNKYQREVDMPALPGVLGLEVVRHYNSSYSRAYVPPGLLGRGWLLSYEARLYDHSTNLQIVQADGTRIIFSKLREHPSLCASEQPGNGIVRIEGPDTKGTKETKPGQERHYTWQWMDGRELRFNHRGHLTRISLPSGEQVRLDYNDKGNRLLKVTDPQGRSLRLHYAKASNEGSFTGVQAIDTPLGRIDYRHGSAPLPGSTQPQAKLNASLVQVILPSADGQAPVQRHYHYDDPQHPTLLTGISVQGQGSDGKPMDERIASYGYGDNGRATLSVRGPPDSQQEKVTLDLSQPWKNTLTNSLGQQTTYHYDTIGGQWRLLEVRGPGCASCGPGDMRYRYDAQGRLTEATRLDPAGHPLEGTRTELDPFGRPLAVYRIAYTQGQARAPQLQVRYGYGKDPWKQYAPELIARPSVVPGREHQIRIRYNSSRQPLQITETGFSPLDAQGQPAGNADGATPIERSTRYRYTEINGRSVLVDIDGPLPTSLAGYDDGSPAQNDLTRLRWDRSGSHVTRVLQPDGTTVALEHDQAGRITTRTEDDGVRRLQRQIRYSALSANALQAEEISTSGWLLDADGQPRASSRLSLNPYRIRHDALGRPSHAIDTAGRSTTWTYQGSTQARLDGLGNRGQIERDSEGRIKRLGLYREGQDLPERAAYYGWNAQGRLSHRLLPDGRLDSYTYGDAGELLQHTDGDDIRTRWLNNGSLHASLSQAPDGWIRLALQGSSSVATAPQDIGHQTTASQGTQPAEHRQALHDDFGRTVWLQLADHGRQSARYNEADQLRVHTRADGSSTHYQYAPSGRLLAKTYEPAPGADRRSSSQTRLHYQGRLLQTIDSNWQRESIGYDALGRPVARTIALATPDGQAEHTYRTATRYGPDGWVHSRTLADGRVLVTRRGPASEGASVQGLQLQSAWVAGLLQASDHWLGTGATGLLERLLPAQTVAGDIGIDAFNGLQHYTAGNGLATSRQYDIAGRLTQQTTGQGTSQGNAPILSQRYRYGVGPRIRAIEQDGRPADANTEANAPADLHKTDYRYQGFGRLVQDNAPSAPAPVQLDSQGRTVQDALHRYAYTEAGQLQSISDHLDRPIASYRYNSLGQRVGKTVHQGDGQTHSHYLWQDNRLVAEMDGEGRITSQYLYLSEGTRTLPIAKLESEHNRDNASGKARMLHIHNDHRGSPQAMTDAGQRVVWRARQTPWGAPAMHQAGHTSLPRQQAVLNLRLPGQYFDEESGLHDNWHRSYDPASGRYLQPDPLGYPDGPDAYLYAGGDPLNRIDPTGLYQEDMHYYMVFFLALAAGLDYEPARITALASQYVDDNPITRPLDDETVLKTIGSIFKNKRQLLWYHFTLSNENGRTLKPYDNDNVNSVVGNLSPQLNNLLAASRLGNPEQPCAEFQFLGEFLHAYLDTFSHRGRDNRPVDALTLGLGIGHGFSGSEPDYTYNGDPDYTGNDPTVNARHWNVRADRTLAGQKAVYEFLTSYGIKPAIGFEEIESILVEFNKIREDGKEFPGKTEFLQDAINDLIKKKGLDLTKNRKNEEKIKVIELDFKKDGADAYNKGFAEINREKYLGGLTGREEDYPGVCLPRSPICKDV
ncbi:DUF6765 family protein [Delftia sp. UME58]|uniref:DUF6765 family protein n=1 Tax=Delftia sp. UME58 TaxID=1862322 RepID=UPI00217F9511|nr:DUF6765 family protein [Delftia sp. UME58]